MMERAREIEEDGEVWWLGHLGVMKLFGSWH